VEFFMNFELWNTLRLLIIIKTRPIFMFQYVSHPTYLYIQIGRGWLLETDRARRTMFKMSPVHTQSNDPEISGTEPEHTVGYRVLSYAW